MITVIIQKVCESITFANKLITYGNLIRAHVFPLLLSNSNFDQNDFSLYFHSGMRNVMIEIGKVDVKGRQYPRSYAIWATQHDNQHVQQMVTMRKSHHSSEPCEDKNKYICQRPAAALQGSEALG